MSRYILSTALVILCAGASVLAQETSTGGSASARSATSAAADGKAINLQSGTQLGAQLQNTLDVRKAKVGDRVVLKTTNAIKSNGRIVVDKGARLVGRVTDVQQSTSASGASSVSLVFDRLESGSLQTPINATITSITRAGTHSRVDDGGIASSTSAQSNTRASSSSRQSSGGSVLGGVTGTVGNVVDSTARTTGSVVGGTTGAVGETVGGVTEGVGGIRISQSSDTSVGGSTTVSLTGDNLRLEKGTSFRLRLNQSASVGQDN